MAYTIKQVSEMMSLPVSTIRYYDKMGLIPFLEKNESGYRIFKEKDIRKAFYEAKIACGEKKGDRQEWIFYNSKIMALQEFFLLYDEENQTYTFKEYATYLCDKVFKMLSDRFNPTIIEITCTDLYEKLKNITEEKDLEIYYSNLILLFF